MKLILNLSVLGAVRMGLRRGQKNISTVGFVINPTRTQREECCWNVIVVSNKSGDIGKHYL